jgi:hypothetical protein
LIKLKKWAGFVKEKLKVISKIWWDYEKFHSNWIALSILTWLLLWWEHITRFDLSKNIIRLTLIIGSKISLQKSGKRRRRFKKIWKLHKFEEEPIWMNEKL